MYRPPNSDEMAKLKQMAQSGTAFKRPRPRRLGRPEVGLRRRHRLGRQRPARRPPDAGDLRGAGRQRRQRRRRRPGRRRVPVQGEPGEDRRRRTRTSSTRSRQRLQQLVRPEEGRGGDHPRPAAGGQPDRLGDRPRCWTRSSPRQAPLGARPRRRPPGHRHRDARPLAARAGPAGLLVPAAVLRLDDGRPPRRRRSAGRPRAGPARPPRARRRRPGRPAAPPLSRAIIRSAGSARPEGSRSAS